jgi:hypothetical protein
VYLQSLSSWKRVVNPDNIPIKDFSVQFRARQTRLAKLEHTAKVPTPCRTDVLAPSKRQKGTLNALPACPAAACPAAARLRGSASGG